MKHKKERKISTLTQQVTSTISVTLVLLLLGIVLALAVVANAEMKSVKSNIGVNITLLEDVSAENVDELQGKIEEMSFVASCRYISPDEVLEEEQKEIGEDLIDLLDGFNPYHGEFDVKLRGEYAGKDSIETVVKLFSDFPYVENVDSRADTFESVNNTFSTLTLILSAIGVILLVISFVLINNTVWLTIYSSRFLIHTMRLVGATPAFIRRPILLRNLRNGVIAGILASLLMTGLRFYSPFYIREVDEMLPWPIMCAIFGALIVAGAAICVLAAYLAANRYLHRDYDDLF